LRCDEESLGRGQAEGSGRGLEILPALQIFDIRDHALQRRPDDGVVEFSPCLSDIWLVTLVARKLLGRDVRSVAQRRELRARLRIEGTELGPIGLQGVS